MIISFVHPKKFGLIDHANALTNYGNLFDRQRNYFTETNSIKLIKMILKGKLNGNKCVCVFWDNSFSSLSAILVCLLLGSKRFYYLHEPGGIKQKMNKGDPLTYSIRASIAEAVMKLLSSKILIPRKDKLNYGDNYAPLLFDDNRPNRLKKTRVIGFLGAKREHRLYQLFQSISERLIENNYEIRYFPSAGKGKEIKDKIDFLKDCCAIWNCYGVSYNQSGVTGDCVASGVPCIVSSYEPFLKELDNLGILIQIDITLSKNEIVLQLLDLLKHMENNETFYDAHKKELASKFGGKLAFLEHWKNIL